MKSSNQIGSKSPIAEVQVKSTMKIDKKSNNRQLIAKQNLMLSSEHHEVPQNLGNSTNTA
jgi:hypothetical protein